jgi:hypothetical protein
MPMNRKTRLAPFEFIRMRIATQFRFVFLEFDGEQATLALLPMFPELVDVLLWIDVIERVR